MLNKPEGKESWKKKRKEPFMFKASSFRDVSYKTTKKIFKGDRVASFGTLRFSAERMLDRKRSNLV